MAGGVNKAILVGNLGKDPEVRHLESGTAVANFPIATSESYKDRNGEKKTITEWHNIVLWRGLAEVAERFLKKGDQVYIEGKIRSRQWEDRDGNTRYTTEIVGDNMTMLGGKGQRDSDSPGYSSSPSQQTAEDTSAIDMNKESMANEEDADDLPF